MKSQRRDMKRTELRRRTPMRSGSRLQSGTNTPRANVARLQRHQVTKRSRVATPDAVQKDWREMVRDLGSIITGAAALVEIHHCAGRTARHNRVAIGHWWILPLTHDEHQGPEGIHAHPDRKAREKRLFERVLVRVVEANHGIPACWPPAEVLCAIRDFHR